MTDLSTKTTMFFDHGLGLPIAERLARDFGRVLYFTEWQEGFSTINKAIIGDGIDRIERCMDFWTVKDEIDLWVFPDIQHSGLQLELERQGKAVWGSRGADRLETDRQHFMELLSKLGLDVPKFKVCKGISALRDYLRVKDDCYIKISRYRGSLETKHWRSWQLDENLIDLWAVRFGAVRELIPFLVFDAINTPLEIGGDTYCVDGKWPSLMLHGIEWKDQAYTAAVTKRDEMPEQLQTVLEAFGPVLADYRYRNEWSMEVRVRGDKFYFIDPTCRLGLPSTGSQLELWRNYSEIVWAGAHGELVEPEPVGRFSAELIVHAKGDDGLWPTVEVPNELNQWLKLADCCEVNGRRAWPRNDGDDDSVGWLVATGDTMEETIETLKRYVALLPDGLTADIGPVANIINEIEQAESEGVEFTEQPIPPAETVISDA